MNRNRLEIPGVRKVKKGTLKDQISSQIKELILTNQLRPGQPIVIDKLADQLGVSHTPVREALAMLELDGLIELSSFQNPIIADVTALDVREIYEMRFMVEGWAIERAALNLPDEQIDAIEHLVHLARQEAQQNNYTMHLKADLLLHETILKSTNNSLFWHLAQKIHERSIRVRSLVEAKGTAQDVLVIIDEHCLVIQALRAHDPIGARRCMLAHLEAGLQRTIAALEP